MDAQSTDYWLNKSPEALLEKTREKDLLTEAAPELLDALNQILRPYGVADVGMNNAPAPLQIEFIEVVQKARAAIAKATGA